MYELYGRVVAVVYWNEPSVTVCVTVFALLELYKRGEAGWEQAEPFGEITVHAAEAAPAEAAA